MEIIYHLIEHHLESLAGADYVIAVIAIVVGVIGWIYLSSKPHEKRPLIKRLLFVLLVITLAITAFLIVGLIPPKPFPDNFVGVIVVQIKNDDSTHSLQDEVISSINNEVANERDPQLRVEARAVPVTIDEEEGLEDAHAHARAIGELYHATVVVWGTKFSNSPSSPPLFAPRATIVDDKVYTIKLNNALDIQDVTSINFPIEIANKPLFLARFVAGFLSYHGGRFDTALDQLNKASDAVPPDSHEIAELYYYIGACHALIAKNLDSQSKDPSADLEAMLSNFEKADAVYVRSRDSHNHGKMQLLLGNIYFSVPFPPPPDNLHKSINCFQTAATLLKGSSSRQDWANAESSLGDAYSTLFLDEEGTSWKNAVDAYNASLTVFTKAAFPSDWAAIQYHLGILYKHVRFNNLSAGLNEEIKAFESASLVFTAQDKPEQWCQMQYEIGFAWQTLSKINRDNTQPDLENAIRSYTKALNVQKAKNAYHDWAMTEFMLGLAYIDLKTGDQSENLNRARSYTIDSLTALTSANDSKLHAMGEHTLSVIDSLDRELAAAHQKSDAIH